MINKKIFCLLFFMAGLMLGSGCGGGTESPEDSGSAGNFGNSAGSGRLDRAEREYSPVPGNKSTPPGRPGAITVNIARSGSVLPPGAMRVFVAFDEVSVYRGGEGWTPLPLKHDPYRIEPYNLPLWTSAALTQPAELPPGKYSRIRIGIKEANILIRNFDQKIAIPKYSLKTDKDIEFETGKGNPTDLVAVLNLAQSIQPFGESYKLFPTFYVIDDRKAAALRGSIQKETLGLGGGSPYTGKVWVIVYQDRDRNRRASSGEEIARVAVQAGTDSSVFEIRWLPPKENYIVNVEPDDKVIYKEQIEARDFPEGSVFGLNKGKPI